MLDFTAALDRLMASEELAQLSEDAYLAHVLKIPDERPEWQFGFYHPAKDTVVVFNVDVTITVEPESEVFKAGPTVEPLLLEKVNLGSVEALELAHAVLRDFKEIPTKTILLLQHIAQGQVWNCTFVTMTASLVNVKIDAATGEVVSKNKESLLQWRS